MGKRTRMAVVASVALVALAVAGVIARALFSSPSGPGEGSPDTSAQYAGNNVPAPSVRLGDGQESTSQLVTTEGDADVPGETSGDGQASGTSALTSGDVGYDDIPEPTQIEGGYETDDIKDAVLAYMRTAYPTVVAASVELLGNGTSPSQLEDEESSYACYLVRATDGRRFGLFVQCSDSEEPHVTEAGYLFVSPTLLYDVESDEYIPMDVPEGGEDPGPGTYDEPTPPAGGYPDPYELPEPGSYEDRMRRLPIPVEEGTGE